jgi:hypothetical protein
MKTGVIVLAHRPVPETVVVAQWYADRLTERGRKNVCFRKRICFQKK